MTGVVIIPSLLMKSGNSMAKLHAKITSDKTSRIETKTGNQEITTIYYNGNLPVFEVSFLDDKKKRGTIKVMSYFDGEEKKIPYDPN